MPLDMVEKKSPNSEEEVLGWTRVEGGWEAIIQPRNYIYTCAFILCTACRKTISAYGGPRYNSYCLKCRGEIDELERTRAG